MNFTKPTPIQAATIPIALLGRDLCACAVTGSGKLSLILETFFLIIVHDINLFSYLVTASFLYTEFHLVAYS